MKPGGELANITYRGERDSEAQGEKPQKKSIQEKSGGKLQTLEVQGKIGQDKATTISSWRGQRGPLKKYPKPEKKSANTTSLERNKKNTDVHAGASDFAQKREVGFQTFGKGKTKIEKKEEEGGSGGDLGTTKPDIGVPKKLTARNHPSVWSCCRKGNARDKAP